MIKPDIISGFLIAQKAQNGHLAIVV